MPTIGPRWDTLNCDDAAADALAAALKISPIVAKLLCQRGLSDPELANRFLNPSLDHLHDPMLLADMGVAVVIVNHLRTVATLLHEILPRYTKMPVELITERLLI